MVGEADLQYRRTLIDGDDGPDQTGREAAIPPAQSDIVADLQGAPRNRKHG
jgi:hypothetical protein